MIGQEHSESADASRFTHGKVSYLQIPALDVAASAVFYERVFGWRVQPPQSGFEAPGLIGQWVDDRPPAANTGVMIWINVEDIDASVELVRVAGGEGARAAHHGRARALAREDLRSGGKRCRHRRTWGERRPVRDSRLASGSPLECLPATPNALARDHLRRMRTPYFAYGSNMDEQDMRRRCPGSRPLGSARLDGHRLAFTRRSIRSATGVADVLPTPGHTVWGALYELDEDEFEVLDRKEGVGWAYVRAKARDAHRRRFGAGRGRVHGARQGAGGSASVACISRSIDRRSDPSWASSCIRCRSGGGRG